MDFDEASIVVNLLAKPDGGFLRIDVLYVTRPPTHSTKDIEPITPSAAGQLGPIGELLLVLGPEYSFLVVFLFRSY